MNQHAYAARKRATYFQFPLCAFAFGRNVKDRLNAIIHFSIVETGQKHWRNLTKDGRRTFIERHKDLPSDFDGTHESQCMVICGANVTRVRIGSVRYCFAQHAKLKAFVDKFERRHGRDAMVRLRTDLVFEARKGNGITPCELSLLAAIYSIIGRKQDPVLIAQDYIACRALGYKSNAVMSIELPKRHDGAVPLSAWKIRSRIDHLQVRKFFARVTYGRRLSYYSHRMTHTRLRKALIEKKTHHFATKRLAQLDDQAMTDAIRNGRAALAGQPPPVPNAKLVAQRGEIAAEDVF